MKKINLVEANKLLTKWALLDAFNSLAQNKSIDFIYKVQEVQRLVNSAVKVAKLDALYRAKQLLEMECDYFKPDKAVLYYKNNIDPESIKEIKEIYKSAKTDLDYVNEQIKTIELNTYIEMK